MVSVFVAYIIFEVVLVGFFFKVRSVEPFFKRLFGIDLGRLAAIATLLFKTNFCPLDYLSPVFFMGNAILFFYLTDPTLLIEGLICAVMDRPACRPGKIVELAIIFVVFFFFDGIRDFFVEPRVEFPPFRELLTRSKGRHLSIGEDFFDALCEMSSSLTTFKSLAVS